jgi:hypothetical protein
MAVPADWEKVDVQGIDSHVGAYHGETADLEFDDVGVFFGPSPTKESKKAIKEFRRKEAHPKLLKPGEEIWHVDGRIALFWSGKADPNENGVRRFSNVAWLDIPYSDSRGYLYISIFYRSEEELPMVRRVLKSLEWPKDLAGPR